MVVIALAISNHLGDIRAVKVSGEYNRDLIISIETNLCILKDEYYLFTNNQATKAKCLKIIGLWKNMYVKLS